MAHPLRFPSKGCGVFLRFVATGDAKTCWDNPLPGFRLQRQCGAEEDRGVNQEKAAPFPRTERTRHPGPTHRTKSQPPARPLITAR